MSRFFPSPAPHCRSFFLCLRGSSHVFFLSRNLLVEFWCLTRRDPQMCTLGSRAVVCNPGGGGGSNGGGSRAGGPAEGGSSGGEGGPAEGVLRSGVQRGPPPVFLVQTRTQISFHVFQAERQHHLKEAEDSSTTQQKEEEKAAPPTRERENAGSTQNSTAHKETEVRAATPTKKREKATPPTVGGPKRSEWVKAPPKEGARRVQLHPTERSRGHSINGRNTTPKTDGKATPPKAALQKKRQERAPPRRRRANHRSTLLPCKNSTTVFSGGMAAPPWRRRKAAPPPKKGGPTRYPSSKKFQKQILNLLIFHSVAS